MSLSSTLLPKSRSVDSVDPVAAALAFDVSNLLPITFVLNFSFPVSLYVLTFGSTFGSFPCADFFAAENLTVECLTVG
mgnify:CR=1 FL=1